MSLYKKIGKYLRYVVALLGIGIAFASIPNEYMANYDIKDDWSRISQSFVQIESSTKLGLEIPAQSFADLNQYFSRVLPRFPQDYSFKVVYQQCLDLTDALGTVYTYNNFVSFMDNCYKPFKEILTKINSQYTVTANASLKPASGPAPLTVTFDARASKDPSNETIPSKNYYWYYRDTNGQDKTIGVGPVINYTFKDPGNYLVHLTVRSSNALTQGIFDGEKTVSVDVAPKTAVISVYANGQKLTQDKKAKIGTQEAEKGVVFDGSATIPMGGRKIISHTRNVTSQEGFSFTQAGEGLPGTLRISLPGQGEFKVNVTTVDNESNSLTETFSLLVSDPVAIIKASPEQGNTSVTFAFDSSPSYSIVSRIKLYTWEVFDGNGNKVDTFQGKSIKKQFKEPGSYTVKLTVEDEIGQSNIDTISLFVESTDPTPQFSREPTLDWKLPSQFVLDAGLTSDIDVVNNVDTLSYDWSFENPSAVEIVSTEEDNKLVVVNFNQLGKHTVKLTVTDSYGKSTEIEKEIQIDSILRPEIFASPKAAVRGTTINFVVKANEPIINYEWDFGDGEKRTLQTNKVSHKYQKVGVYMIKLKVSGSNGASNEIQDLAFVGDQNSPIAAYTVYNRLSMTLKQNDICTETSGLTGIIEHPAYRIDRYQDFRISSVDSVNTRGEKTDLVFYYQPKQGEIYKQTEFTSRFNELGCQYVDVTVEDTSVAVNNKVRIWFRVVNSLPTLQNVLLSFPQFGNELGVGFQENNVKDIFDTTFDPLIVRVTAQQPVDSDGFISYFKWYYYYKDDPTRVIETKITPQEVPYAYFSLPRTPGEFMFGVTMYDNDDGVQTSEEIIGNGPIVFFPPDTKKPDIPIVTLKVDKVSVEVGDEITFDAIAKIISDRPDFIQERTIQYDFDGDGEYDLTTKKDRVTHVYDKPNDKGYTPRVAVLYRGYKGVAKGGTIVVKKGLKPQLLFDANGKFVIFRNTSIGEIEKQDLCLSLLDCQKGNTSYMLSGTDLRFFAFDYPSYGDYFVSLTIGDKYANESNKKRKLQLTSPATNTGSVQTGTELSGTISGEIAGVNVGTGLASDQSFNIPISGNFTFLSIPEATVNASGLLSLFVGKNLQNSILYYVAYENTKGECYIDLDVTDAVDKDFYCNQLYFKTYDPKFQEVVGRLYYEVEGKMVSEDFTVNFLDYAIELSARLQKIYDVLGTLVTTINVDIEGNKPLKELLVNLRNNIVDENVTSANVVDIQSYLSGSTAITLTDKEQEDLQWALGELLNETTVSAQGGNVYEQAKAEILLATPETVREDVAYLFGQFEAVESDPELQLSQQDTRKSILNQIIDLIGAQAVTLKEGEILRDDQIDSFTMQSVILPRMCDILNFYTIPSETCSSTDLKPVPDVEVTKTSGGIASWLKVSLWILGVIIFVFVVLVGVFAIRAKLSKEREEEEVPPVQ